jgi:(hydroxyamino)benzene mutase
MSTPTLSRACFIHGAVILVLGLTAGLTIQFAAQPETVLSAHVIGITAGSVAIVTGLALPHLRLSVVWQKVAVWLLLPCLWLGFLTQWIGGLFGLTRMFIVTAAGLPEGNQTAELIIEVIVKGISPLTILPFVILAVGAVRMRPAAA